MLLPPRAPLTDFPAIAQSAQYSLDAAALPAAKVAAVNFPLDALSLAGSVQPTIDVNGYSGDPTLGQLVGIAVLTARGVTIAPGTGTLTIDSSGPQPDAVLTYSAPGAIGFAIAGYALPRSATLNSAGFTYQTFGGWSAVPSAGVITDGFVSFGIPTTAGIPVSGIASYSGPGQGTFVNATNGDPSDVVTTVTAQVDFVARTITLSTAATTTVSTNAPAGTAPTSSPALNLRGVLTYPVATNTFVGIVTSANGMSGNVTGRFYGTPLGVATATKAVGSPPEIGGTFAVLLPGVGSLEGAFGAQ
jgi:hypothetical protein